jgi:signal transduction histidine kinase
VDVPARLPEQIEVAAYYVVSEAFTNAAKHAEASLIRVEAGGRDGELRLSVSDDGVGGAALAQGSGLIGLIDRVEAAGGTLSVVSPAGQGTVLLSELPLADA